tara:strand:+ start:639 stop:1223 length:585 start_codon:yes stop_codon:yes gene_type:complete
MIKLKKILEGTCGYGENGELGEEPAGPHLIKKKKIKEFDAKMQKNHFLNLIKQEIESLKGQIAYAKDKVRYKGTPDWEKKEFKGVLKDLFKKLKDSEKHYKRVQKLKEEKLTEGKFQMKGKYLYMPSGEVSSIPTHRDRDAIVVGIKYNQFKIYMDGTKPYAYGSRYDKRFNNTKDLVKWLNDSKAKYIGIDNK